MKHYAYTFQMLMEFATDKDLSHVLEKNGGPLKFKDFWLLFIHGIVGLTYMHLLRIAHRDIKPGNILKLFQVFVLADYGLSVDLSMKD